MEHEHRGVVAKRNREMARKALATEPKKETKADSKKKGK